MIRVGADSVPLYKPQFNPLLYKHSTKLFTSIKRNVYLGSCQKPRTLLRNSGSFTVDLTLRRGKSRLLLPPLGAASADSDGTRPNEPTTTNAEKSSRDDTSSSPSSLEISPPAALADAASSSSTPSDDPEQPQTQRKKSPKSTPPPRRSNNNESWLSKLAAKIKPGTSVRYILNVLAFMLLIRIVPMPGVSNSPLSQPDGVVLRISFSEFVRSVRRNEIARVVVDGNHLSYALQPKSEIFIKGALKDIAFDQRKISFETMRPTDWPTPYETMLANGVQISAVEKKGGLFGTVLNYVFIALLLITVLNRFQLKFPTGRGGAGTGRRHTSTTQTKNGKKGLLDDTTHDTPSRITFDDVAGVDEAKEELQEIVEYLKEPERFTKLGARPPRGVLLVGPPGTGKTLLAKAVAGEANVPFFSISASEFVELYVGMGALRVRELFAQARKEAPCLVFIDEIDAIGKGRDGRLRSVGNDEREQTLNQLLTELDGFETELDQLVICIAATNRADVLDPALLRPGRFDRRVPVERPDRIGREQILRVHIERKELPLGEDVDILAIASQTAGFTGADLANVVNEAALLAGRKDQNDVKALDFDSAILRSVAGLEKKRSVLKGEEKAVVARHEVGHALVATAVSALVPMTNPVERLSIIPRSGGALGFTYSPPVSEDRVLIFENEIRGQLCMLMGGRAAEAATSASISTGAGDDIRRATDLAHRAVAEYGMSTAVGPLSVAALAAGGEDYSLLMDGGGEVNKSVEKEVRSLCESALAAARDVVESNKELHSKISRELEREERLDGVALRELLEKTQVPPSLRKFVTGVGK